MSPERDEWYLRGACRSTDDPDLFHQENISAWNLRTKVIAVYCDQCPVATECLEDALSYPIYSQQGVWGGTTPEQRRRILRSRRPRR